MAAVLHGAQDLRIEQVPLADLGADEVRVAVRATGICGSDIHYLMHGRNGAFELRHPMILGHESAGTVVSVGKDVKGIAPGDNVAIEAGVPCRTCLLCRSGRYNLCAKMQFAASAKVFPHRHGTLQRFINHPQDFVHKLPAHLSYEEGALMEPLCVAMQAVDRANVSLGQRVIVMGAGAVGLLCAAAARAAGATDIIMMDIDQARLDFALKYAATRTYLLPLKKNKEQDNLSFARGLAADILGSETNSIPQGDVVFECTGVESCVQLSIQMALSGGKVVLVGMGTPVQTVPMGDASLREVDLIGVFRYANQYPKAIALVAAGQLDLKSLVTQRFDLPDSVHAFETVRRGGPDVRKVVITSKY